ncbi:radical SAM protein [candidate division KSB1 bacterium]|nr:radical SAM protein [candidate division KSB1 bacterium]
MSTSIHEITCQSILNRSRIPGLDYTLNPYIGCLHGCVYCYACFMTRFAKHPAPWGQFCEAKVNAPEILQKQIGKLPPGLVSLSTVTDPYQHPEKQYAITRQLLDILFSTEFTVSILTRSDLVLRDLDILKQFLPDHIEVGFSLALMDDSIRKVFEPRAPSIQKRIDALKQIHDKGIRTWVFLAPVMPTLTTKYLLELLKAIQNKVDYILVDTLNIKGGSQVGLKQAVHAVDPNLVKEWEQIFSSSKSKHEYYMPVFKQISDWGNQSQIEVKFCR